MLPLRATTFLRPDAVRTLATVRHLDEKSRKGPGFNTVRWLFIEDRLLVFGHPVDNGRADAGALWVVLTAAWSTHSYAQCRCNKHDCAVGDRQCGDGPSGTCVASWHFVAYNNAANVHWERPVYADGTETKKTSSKNKQISNGVFSHGD